MTQSTSQQLYFIGGDWYMVCMKYSTRKYMDSDGIGWSFFSLLKYLIANFSSTVL